MASIQAVRSAIFNIELVILKRVEQKGLTGPAGSILEDVADELEVDNGDHILFYEKEDGEIVIKKG